MTQVPHTDAGASGRRRRLAYFAWSVLAYNILVILWGAFVRATGSGAGCGRHWPLCNGEVVPRPESIETVIEVTHRATSGIALIAVFVLLYATRRVLPVGHRARRGAAYATFFIITEALIGAGLVLFELVAFDASMKRAFSMVLHLGNTFLLLAALALTAWWMTVRDHAPAPEEASRRPVFVRATIGAALVSVLLVGASGAIAALGDTLFPASSLREGLAQDLSPVAHAFVRLRVLHPVLALLSGVVVLGAAGLVRAASSSARARVLARIVTVLFVAQFAGGLLNLWLLAPVWMQLVHLLFADAVWIALVLMGWEAWGARGRALSPALGPSPSPTPSR